MEKRNKNQSMKRMTMALVIMLLSLFTLLKTGKAVSGLNGIIHYLLGSITPFVLCLIIYVCIQYLINLEYKFFKSQTFWAFTILLGSLLIFFTKSFGFNEGIFSYMSRLSNTNGFNGGFIGYIILKPIHMIVGGFGLTVIGIILFLIGAYAVYTLFYEVDDNYLEAIRKKITPSKKTVEQRRTNKEERDFFKNEKEARKETRLKEDVKIKKDDTPKNILDVQIKKDEDIQLREIKEDNIEATPEKNSVITKTNEENNLELKEVESITEVDVMKIEESVTKKATQKGKYTIPPIELLSDGLQDLKALERLEITANENAKILEMTLESFNLKATIIKVSIGPNITKYELQPEIGTKINKFSSLSNDLAMALAATSIRIEAPIPGKAAVGIEIPNKEILPVSLKDVLQSKNNDMDKKLQVALGKDITGESKFMEINKTPHMLVAGATGSGKSVAINSFILSILLKASPDEVKMIMIDPKKVELAPYNGIPHLITPVVTEPKRAAVILKKMVLEMETRYELFAKTNTRNIESFNVKLKKDNPNHYKELPYIVIIIDELADLMMVASNEVETSIARLAQMARAAGIHLVIATQRPSTDVITGLIKSNIPTRLSFSVSSSIDSRTILDQSGAEKLLGKGDMLYAANGTNYLNRIQGTFVSDDEIIEVVDYIKAQEYNVEKLEDEQKAFEKEIEVNSQDTERDELFDEAVEIVINANTASTSLLQRRLRIGFNRASNIMEQMEAAGVVSTNEGTKPRRVLVSGNGENNE